MGYTIELRHQERQPYAAIRTTIPMSGIGGAMGPLYQELYGSLGRRGIGATGEPWTRYLVVGGDEVELEVGTPVADQPAAEGRVAGGVLPAGDVVATEHVGPYARLPEAYAAITEWIESHHLTVAGAMWEVYLNDPSSEPDQSGARTRVCFPVVRA